MRRGNLGERVAYCKVVTLCCELCRNGWTDRLAVWVVDSRGSKEAQVWPYLPGGANVPRWESTLAPPGEQNWTICLQRQCSLMSNYFDHLLLLLLVYSHYTGQPVIQHPQLKIWGFCWTAEFYCPHALAGRHDRVLHCVICTVSAPLNLLYVALKCNYK